MDKNMSIINGNKVGDLKMNIGQRIVTLKEGAGFKNYKEFGDFVGLPNDWCLELSKRAEVTNIDITRLQRIAYKFNVTIDWLLSDFEDDERTGQFPEDDLTTILTKLKEQVKEGMQFEGAPITSDIAKMAHDSIDIVRMIIRHNL